MDKTSNILFRDKVINYKTIFFFLKKKGNDKHKILDNGPLRRERGEVIWEGDTGEWQV